MPPLTPAVPLRSQTPLTEALAFAASPGSLPPEQIPPGLDWEGGRLSPPFNGLPAGAAAGFARTDLLLPPHAGRRAWLRFEQIAGQAVFFLNGKRIYASSESSFAVEFDLTDHTDQAENELIAWFGPPAQTQSASGAALLAVPGGAGAPPAGPLGQLWLEIAPAVTIPTAAVRTWLRRAVLELDISLENRTLAPLEAVLHARILSGEAELLCLPTQALRLEAGVLTTLRCSAPHSNALRPWSPASPQTYTLETRLERSGELLDQRRQTFGLRELWQERGQWLLNGQALPCQPVPLPASPDPAAARADLLALRARGTPFARLAGVAHPALLTAADELGILIEAASAVNGGGPRLQADHPAFLQSCRDHLRALVRRDRGHPSVLAWRLDRAMQASAGWEGYRKARPELKTEIRALDPTRALLWDEQNWPISSNTID